MNKNPERHSIAFPFLLIAFGVIFLLSNIGVLPGQVWEMVFRFWPALFIVTGLDNLYKREGLVGPLFSIGIGIIFLFSTLGVVPFNIWDMIFRFWPILVIVLGFDIILGWGREPTIIKALIGVGIVGLLLLGVIFLTSIDTTQVVSRSSFDQTLDSANKGVIQITGTAGELLVSSLIEDNYLLRGEFNLSRAEVMEQEYSIQNGVANLSLKSKGFIFLPNIGNRDNPAWNIRLSSQIPLQLETTLPMGKSTLNLTNLNLDMLQVTTVMGANEITLPANGIFKGDITGVMGSTTVIVPEGTSVRFEVDKAITAVEYPPDYEQDDNIILSPNASSNGQWMDIRIKQTIGKIEIRSSP